MSQLSFYNVIQSQNVEITRVPIEILQINVGRLCNQACHHCHVEAGPTRTENMSTKTVHRVLELIENAPTLLTIDLTGGAPELNPNFRLLVREARALGKEVIDRCNLTVLFEKGQEDTALFLRDNGVHVIASLPCYSKENVEKQRGRGVFSKSIEALKILNHLGYGKSDPRLKLDLVYNPLGAFLPPSQGQLELDYKKELRELFGIDFNRLFTITNMPIKRFLDDLKKANKFEAYMELLVNKFNPHAANGVMCKNLVSIGWDGKLFDCDFNQMLDLPIGSGTKTIWDISSLRELNEGPIAFANHCFGCTAGAGSSCGGTLV